MEEKILIVEDDHDINNLLKSILSTDYTISQAYDGELAKQLIANQNFDLIILDLMLPFLSGEEIIQLVRDKQDTPVLVITAKSEVNTLVDVFDLGADDYISKPFQNKEVLARVKQIFKKSEKMIRPNQKSVYGSIVLDPNTFSVFVNGDEVTLTSKEFEVLKVFMSDPKRVFTKSNIYEIVWRERYIGDDNTISVHISRLRSKLQKHLGYDPIETIWGVGFKLKANEHDNPSSE